MDPHQKGENISRKTFCFPSRRVALQGFANYCFSKCENMNLLVIDLLGGFCCTKPNDVEIGPRKRSIHQQNQQHAEPVFYLFFFLLRRFLCPWKGSAEIFCRWQQHHVAGPSPTGENKRKCERRKTRQLIRGVFTSPRSHKSAAPG